MMKFLFFFLVIVISFTSFQKANEFPWQEHGELQVSEGINYILHNDAAPFLWIGCTAWGMTEWLSREEVDFYLDDRKSKGMNVVQLCLFWGKREDYPTQFTANSPNYYGHKAFKETNEFPDARFPDIEEGGSAIDPNDYWDHVDYCLNAIRKRGMYAAVLPFWGRRYVNGLHEGQSAHVFTMENIFQYGEFLGNRYAHEPNIIWVNGGDVKADAGGDYLQHYRRFAEGLVYGVTGQAVKWNQTHEAWDAVFITYHPDGSPMINSSNWFHRDAWLDFNMIETFVNRDFIVQAIQQDLKLPELKPTVLGEPHYEGITGEHKADAIHIRRQAYQAFFAGAAGFTYGGGFDNEGNGPLFSPANNWKPLLNQKGASQLKCLRMFLEENKWYNWKPIDVITKGKGEGELEKIAIKNGNSIFIYFPDNTEGTLSEKHLGNVRWYNTQTGVFLFNNNNDGYVFSPPKGWEDGILMLSKDG